MKDAVKRFFKENELFSYKFANEYYKYAPDE